MKSNVQLKIEKMNNYIYILSIALLSALSCSKQMDFPSIDEVQNVPENAKLTLEFSVPLPEQTKGEMANTPDITGKMFVLVFNTNTGALIEAP